MAFFHVAGQPDLWRVYDMIGRVETAAMYNDVSFLDFDVLHKQSISTIMKAVKMEFKSDFYEITTPKAPIEVTIKLKYVGDKTMITWSEAMCGGKMKPSIKIQNMHHAIDTNTRQPTVLPDWWKDKFSPDLPEFTPFSVEPNVRPLDTHVHMFAVPLSDADTSGHTRCASYVRYFIDNASIASSRSFYKNIANSFHEFHIKKMSMLYFHPSKWGQTLTSETWEDDKKRLKLHCIVRKDEIPVWYGNMEFFPEVFS